ncbi:hypothetical protein AZE42_12987 [Rhizopogon vesiculosus]|uniref:Uncharacterized protein n=1 Tax=Rhizopogon vesiculosus TaxID=180088 RepID=A0A1J8PKZ4_9AGAM|nr:hypothetical protein AZE42_12987 [Rhizopogon vesiculosus]
MHSPSPVFTKKENATLAQCIEILDWYHANSGNQSKTAIHFDAGYQNLRIKQPLVSAWVKGEAKWQEEWEHMGTIACAGKQARQTQHPEVTEMMDLWVSKAMSDDLLLTVQSHHFVILMLLVKILLQMQRTRMDIEALLNPPKESQMMDGPQQEMKKSVRLCCIRKSRGYLFHFFLA